MEPLEQTEPLLTVDTRDTRCSDDTCPQYGKLEVTVTLWKTPDGDILAQACCCSNPPDVEALKRLMVEGRA